MIVVDTNIISYLFIPGEHTESVQKLLRKDSDWAAPVLWRSEFRSVLALYMRKKHLTMSQACYIMDEALLLMRGNEYQVNSDLVFEMVAANELSAYDCEFAALAKELNMPLITCDKKILSQAGSIAISLYSFNGDN